MTSLKLLDAAQLIEDAYANALSDVHTAIDVRGVQAYYLTSGVLVIPGTNEFSDWFDFNLDLFHTPGSQGHGFDVVPGDSGSLWHAGFLEHAQIVYSFAKGLRPKFIIGHSLGAASAQIVGTSLRTPSIAFASPQTCRSTPRLPGEGWVINICRVDDEVCHQPPRFLGFRTVGSRYWLSPDTVNVGEDHKIDNYMELLRTDKVKARVPQAWPA